LIYFFNLVFLINCADYFFTKGNIKMARHGYPRRSRYLFLFYFFVIYWIFSSVIYTRNFITKSIWDGTHLQYEIRRFMWEELSFLFYLIVFLFFLLTQFNYYLNSMIFYWKNLDNAILLNYWYYFLIWCS